jgi:hypothetical protein
MDLSSFFKESVTSSSSFGSNDLDLSAAFGGSLSHGARFTADDVKAAVQADKQDRDPATMELRRQVRNARKRLLEELGPGESVETVSSLSDDEVLEIAAELDMERDKFPQEDDYIDGDVEEERKPASKSNFDVNVRGYREAAIELDYSIDKVPKMCGGRNTRSANLDHMLFTKHPQAAVLGENSMFMVNAKRGTLIERCNEVSDPKASRTLSHGMIPPTSQKGAQRRVRSIAIRRRGFYHGALFDSIYNQSIWVVSEDGLLFEHRRFRDCRGKSGWRWVDHSAIQYKLRGKKGSNMRIRKLGPSVSAYGFLWALTNSGDMYLYIQRPNLMERAAERSTDCEESDRMKGARGRWINFHSPRTRGMLDRHGMVSSHPDKGEGFSIAGISTFVTRDKSLFVTTKNGKLFELAIQSARFSLDHVKYGNRTFDAEKDLHAQFQWIDHGQPTVYPSEDRDCDRVQCSDPDIPNANGGKVPVKLVSRPGALLNERSIFIIGEKGRLFERYLQKDEDGDFWRWIAHGSPPTSKFGGRIDANSLVIAAHKLSIFVVVRSPSAKGTGISKGSSKKKLPGILYERYWDKKWIWQEHLQGTNALASMPVSIRPDSLTRLNRGQIYVVGYDNKLYSRIWNGNNWLWAQRHSKLTRVLMKDEPPKDIK